MAMSFHPYFLTIRRENRMFHCFGATLLRFAHDFGWLINRQKASAFVQTTLLVPSVPGGRGSGIVCNSCKHGRTRT